jgi:DNA mismatch repair protein MutS
MFAQYHALKARNPDALLLFRMGDFYEAFFEDAVTLARVAEVTLTSRNKGEPDAIPMAGVPHHAAAVYVQRLTDAGLRVAIAEQMEDPAQAKGIVRRDVVRLVTPGLTWDPAEIGASTSNWLGAVHLPRGRGVRGVGVAMLDVSTGELLAATAADLDAAVAEVVRFEPRELLRSPKALDDEALAAAVTRLGATASPVPDEAWDAEEARAAVRDALGVADVGGFGLEHDEAAVGAVGALIAYARRTLGRLPSNVQAVRTWSPAGVLGIDAATRRNLELFRRLRGEERTGTLMHLVDRARSPMGSRVVRAWIAGPLTDRAAILVRQQAVAALVDDEASREALRAALAGVADIERIVARVAQGSAHARDLVALARSLASVPDVAAAVHGLPALAAHLPVDAVGDVAARVGAALRDDPPLVLTDGGLIREGFDADLDQITALSLDGQGVLRALEAREREATGVPGLRIKAHGTWGHVFEASRAVADRLPSRFIPKQELAGVCRFVTVELQEIVEDVLSADVRRKRREHELFLLLRAEVAEAVPRLLAVARALGALDALAALATVAVAQRWTQPKLVDAPVLTITAGRHPVVEAALPRHAYVPSDLALDVESRRLSIVTGPNMAGKSTILRMAALIVVLAQAGSFVPADAATVGVCDRVFTRVGAQDDLATGRSTFMVEMAETASILHHATDRSLVLLDEIGRGTSTYDGLAIAWAVAEDLVARVRCRAMFATHYHELCDLADTHEGVVNQSVAVRDQGAEIVFLRELRDGRASRSYGVQCARLAGLPAPVVARAAALLRRFEAAAPRDARQQLSLFGVAPDVAVADAGAPDPQDLADPLRDALAALDPDTLAPREALDAIYRLRTLL